MSGPLEMELQAAGSHPVWVLQTKLGPSGKAASTPNHTAQGESIGTWLPLVSLCFRALPGGLREAQFLVEEVNSGARGWSEEALA